MVWITSGTRLSSWSKEKQWASSVTSIAWWVGVSWEMRRKRLCQVLTLTEIIETLEILYTLYLSLIFVSRLWFMFKGWFIYVWRLFWKLIYMYCEHLWECFLLVVGPGCTSHSKWGQCKVSTQNWILLNTRMLCTIFHLWPLYKKCKI